jgi:hypothetical protein
LANYFKSAHVHGFKYLARGEKFEKYVNEKIKIFTRNIFVWRYVSGYFGA